MGGNMREILKLNKSHIDAYTDIAFNAYPSFKDFSKEAMDAYKEEALFIMENDPVVTFYGMFENQELVAVMRLFDFKMNCFGKIIPVSGLGFLGVHLLHKKKGIAKAMVDFYESHYRERQIPIGLLLPFRPDFYKRMGYGLGTKMNHYRLGASRLPKASQMPQHQTSRLSYVKREELEKLLACHRHVMANTHGMIEKFGDEIRPIFGDPFNHIIGVFNEGEEITGYLIYQFKNAKAGNYTITNLVVKELVYQSPEDLHMLFGFIRSQEDQINLVIFNTEDEHFYHLFDNPLNDTHNYIPYGYLETNTQAIGAMYKLFDVRMAFLQNSHRKYGSETLTVRFIIHDNYHGEGLEDVSVSFDDGKVTCVSSFDKSSALANVIVKISIADFSTLFLGISSVRGLYQLGLLTLNNLEVLDTLDRLFYYHQKPVCYTDF